MLMENGAEDLSGSLYDPVLSSLIHEALLRCRADMAQNAPFLAERVSEWWNRLSQNHGPEASFKHPGSFPMLLLPWYLARSLRAEPEREFELDVIRSTVNGYYYIRLIDNVMDREATLELQILPAAGFFHLRFAEAYRMYFEHGHPFWTSFDAAFSEAVDATVRDAFLTRIDEAAFREISGRKFAAARIPIAAVCHRYGRPDLLPRWELFLTGLGRWCQMRNDLFDWEKDDRLQHRTYLLSEAELRRTPEEPLVFWLAREGFDWGIETLLQWMSELRACAENLECPQVLAYLRFREEYLERQAEEAREGLRFLARLLEVL